MTAANLKRILSASGEAASIISDAIGATGASIAVRDLEGKVLLCTAGTDAEGMLEEYSIVWDGKTVGWASGGPQAEQVAALLTYLVAREAEKEDLLDKILDLYRQVNLLFNLSNRLAASLELNSVANTALEEATRLIQATGGAVALLDEEHAPLPIATMGQALPEQLGPGPRGGIVGAVVASAKAEIINDVRLDTRYTKGRDSICSLLCAPLTSRNRVMGAIVIVSQEPVIYTAADLSLLNTLASQAAPAIENALQHERALREAQEREVRLRRQVLELRIELDEVRQKEKVAEITGSEYYQRLIDRAQVLRNIIGGPRDP